MKRLVLASASKSRARLLSAAGVDFEVEPATVDEDAVKTRFVTERYPPIRIADALAELKAMHVLRTRPESLVLGADQLLVLGDEIISKCASAHEAKILLRRLRARKHTLFTAAVLVSNGGIVWRDVARADLKMRAFSDGFLEEYVDHAGPALLECVGCYQLESLGAQLFESIDGDYFSILGLPLMPLLACLREQGVVAS